VGGAGSAAAGRPAARRFDPERLGVICMGRLLENGGGGSSNGF